MKKSKLEVYNTIYNIKKEGFKKEGLNDDKSSRLANMYAVKNTERFWILNENTKNKF